MADQIIFTSAVRGIKPGASGYCTVLRSPGIRTALEQALEKISVFEHNKCNQERLVYTYRQIDIRDKIYYALSRISDAGKDYTGRTNFLAHHLVFEKEELPELSPADILLNWPHWCQQWEGEPREEAVDCQSFAQMPVVKPPVRLWQDQVVGVDGAVKLASDTQNALLLRSKACSDEMLLQLIGEALAVRAKFNQSYKYAWTTPFSVGLAVVGSVKSFKWLALRATDDYALPSAGTVIDLDSSLLGEPSPNEEIIAIAREGQFRPAPKPIPLSQNTAPIRQPIPLGDAQSAKQSNSPQKLRLGKGAAQNSGHPAGGLYGGAVKPRSRNKFFVALVLCVLVLIFSLGFLWLSKHQKMSGSNANYQLQFQRMLELDDQRKKGDLDSSYGDEAGAVFTRMYQSLTPDSSLSLEQMLDEMDQIYWGRLETDYDQSQKDNAQKAFEELRKYLINNGKIVRIAGITTAKNVVELPDVEPLADADEPRDNNIDMSSDGESQNEKEQTAVAKPLDLNNYDEIVIRDIGEEVEVSSVYRNAVFRVAILGGSDLKIMEGEFIDGYKFNLSGGKSLDRHGSVPVLINQKISDELISCGIQINPDSQDRKLILIVGNDWPEGISLGQFKLPDSTAADAIKQLVSVFKVSSIDMRIVDEIGERFRPLPSNGAGASGNIGEKPLNYDLIDAMITDSNSAKAPEEVLISFEEMVSQEIIKHLDDLIEEIDNEPEGRLDKKDFGQFKTLLSDAYKSIKEQINKDFRIASYFKAYEAEVKNLREVMRLAEKAKRDPYDKAITSLVRNHYKDDKIQIKPEAERTYVVTWDDGGDWRVQYENKILNLKISTGKTSKDLSSSLASYIDYRERYNLKQSAMQQNKEEERRFSEGRRKWKSIEFTRPNSQVIATVKIK